MSRCSAVQIVFCALFIFWAFSLSGCGVKAPPIAPESEKRAPLPNLNCSPTEENCDKEDPHYRPRGR
jgi:predicted small lipoprotein YifL